MIGIHISDTRQIAPDRNPRNETQPVIERARFGDGYDYRLPIGYDNFEENIRLTFNNRPLAEIQELKTFFRRMRGATAFNYTRVIGEQEDGSHELETIKVICTRWRDSNRTHTISSLSCQLQRVKG